MRRGQPRRPHITLSTGRNIHFGKQARARRTSKIQIKNAKTCWQGRSVSPLEAFLGNFQQLKKYIKDPVEIHHIKQKEGESTEAFMERFKVESKHVNGALEYMRIYGFMHGITNPDLIKRLNDNIPKTVDEMMSITTSFLKGE
ncbi:hypothetical protein Tco_1348670, partial [Tanacetum coccineum]